MRASEADAVLAPPRGKPAIWGTGLIALDAVVSEGSDPRVWAGGTCGNVLSILSYLGWTAYPISRLSNDSAAEAISSDMAKWKLNLEFLRLRPPAETPVVIHSIRRSREGGPYHRFSWKCPICGAWFPPYRPVVVSAANEALNRLPSPKVFFFDRVSPAALALAKKANRSGALVIFEPSSGVRDERQYKEALRLTHILKYSEERGRSLSEVRTSKTTPLEIETLGPDGLRFRSRLPRSETHGWEYLDPFEVKTFKDAGGAGDWCTAGVIHVLATGGQTAFLRSSRAKLSRALELGQALGAWSCGFEGARGGMYTVGKASFKAQVRAILTRGSIGSSRLRRSLESEVGLFKEICLGCKDE